MQFNIKKDTLEKIDKIEQLLNTLPNELYDLKYHIDEAPQRIERLEKLVNVLANELDTLKVTIAESL